MTEIDTKNQILDVAERLFASKGFAGTSLREITKEAGVNLAAINYHFQSKEKLIQQVYARRITPINKERLKLLDEIDRKYGQTVPPLEEVVRALVGPIIKFAKESKHGSELFMKLYGRLYTESVGFLHEFFIDDFKEVIERFVVLLKRMLPHLTPNEFYWRLRFVGGALLHSLYDPFESGGIHEWNNFRNIDTESITNQLVDFIIAGLTVISSEKKKQV